jgi:hypothetical protein
MSLSILSSYHAVAATNLTVPFGATGGTVPYTWSVVPGGAGGTINSSTGIYTSPSNSYGPDVIQVTDASATVATYPVLVCTAVELVCDVIQTAMGLNNGQVYLWDQKINIPIDSNLYIAVGVQSCKPFGNKPRYVGGSSSLVAQQSVNMYALLSIDILSRGPAARDQKEQVLLALSSPYAEAQMELNSFFIAPLSTNFVNLSHIDGAAIPYRFNISTALQYFSTLTTNPDYYESYGAVQVTEES